MHVFMSGARKSLKQFLVIAESELSASVEVKKWEMQQPHTWVAHGMPVHSANNLWHRQYTTC